MTTKLLLLPNKYKMVGWCILIPATILGIILLIGGFDAIPIHTKVFAIVDDDLFGKGRQYFTFADSYIGFTVAGILFIVGALLVAFSKEKNEDEFIANLRLSSLLWAVLVNYILLLLAFVFVYGIPFLNVMLYNMFTVLVIFIARFNYILYRNFKAARDEK